VAKVFQKKKLAYDMGLSLIKQRQTAPANQLLSVIIKMAGY